MTPAWQKPLPLKDYFLKFFLGSKHLHRNHYFLRSTVYGNL